MINGSTVSAIIVAAGTSKRMGFNKLAYVIEGLTVLEKSVNAFNRCSIIDDIIIVTGDENTALCEKAALACKKPCIVVAGGDTRAVSVQNGLAGCCSDIVAIHDAARPFVSQAIITQTVHAAYKTGAAAPAVPVKDTIKLAKEGIIYKTPPRSCLFAMQTPQVFKLSLYKAALQVDIVTSEITDDCMLFENAGFEVTLINGDYDNYKITTLDDLRSKSKMRIGHGYDVHRLTQNRALILGGVNIPYEKGLLGHSDADVLIHSIMDALLGAAALGDIGLHFPDSEPSYKNVSSMLLLSEVRKKIKAKGLDIGNIDCTILCQAPKLREYIGDMCVNIASELNIDISNINIKATTEEGLGFTGNGDGIAAHAVAVLYNEY